MTIERLRSIMADDLASLHARAFEGPEAWSAAALETCLAQSVNIGFGSRHNDRWNSFIIIQALDDVVEVLTLATDPDFRRQGQADRLMRHIEAEMAPEKWLLDVAEDNSGAIAFYQKMGFQVDGRRPRYYHRLEGGRVDAILMSKVSG